MSIDNAKPELATLQGFAALSFAQERLWFLDQLAPGAATYNIAGALDLAGLLEIPALHGALAAVVDRHEILRTTFITVAPLQIIAPPTLPLLPLADLSVLPPENRTSEAERLSRDEARRGFDLTTGPLLRTMLLRLDAQRHRLCVTFHHIISDGWSSRIFTRDLARFYEAALSGVPAALPPLVQYVDYVEWQREFLDDVETESHLTVLRRRLDGVPPLELPTDRPRPPVPRFRGARQPVMLDLALTTGLAALGSREAATLFNGLTATFQAILSRFSGQFDFAVGAPSANRTFAELEDSIGCFINTLALRADLSGDPTFRELLARTRDVLLEAIECQEVPFERLVEVLRPERDPSRPPLVQVMLTLQSTPLDLQLRNLDIHLLDMDTGTTRLDLLLGLVETRGGLAGYVEYDTDLFDGSSVARLLNSYQTLLVAGLANPDRRVSELPLLGEAERWQVLGEWNAEAVDRPTGGELLHELFLCQAERTPDTVALVVDGQETSYAALRDRAMAIAALLRRQGVGPETRVGIFLDRGPDLVPALLGTLLAGGAYVPLDPAYPAERLAFMVKDSEAIVVLSRRPLASRLPAEVPRCLWLEEESHLIDGLDGCRLKPEVTADHLAYVIYTSGSTGLPKAAAITHASVVALLHWARRIFSPDELAGVVAATTIAFDLSVFEIFAPLVWGGTVLLVENALAIPRLTDGRARLVNTVPSAASWLVSSGDLPVSVRTVNLAGEPLSGELVRDLYAAGVERVYNLYGPSEDTTYSTGARIAPDEPHPEIGRPLPGTRTYVLGPSLEPVPAGVPGELYLGGVGLARGYLGHPELTADRFVPDCLSGEPGARLYRTGDRARQRPDGRLDFLGRFDVQIKIRGFRIELWEIEAVLSQAAEIRECSVLALDEGRELRLIAFVAPRQIDCEALRRHLRSRLPEHMIPAAFVPLDVLPITATGKLDRKALAELASLAEIRNDSAEPPRTPTEEIVAALWSELLGRENLGRTDNFFDLGGHSLLAARMASRVRKALGVEIGLRVLFESPVLADLAGRIEEARRSEALSFIPPLQPVDRGAKLPLSFGQERLWFLHRFLPDDAAYNLPLTLRLDGSLASAALGRALSEVVRRHEILRTHFLDEEGWLVQVIDPPTPVPLPLIDLRALTGAAAEALRIANVEARRPFDLAAGPVLRALLVWTGEREHLFQVTLHHIAGDGWSLGILARELEELYGSFTTARLPSLPDLPVQYADYAVWQRVKLSGEFLSKQLSYWRQRLAGAPEVLDLPTDRPRPVVQISHGRRRRALLLTENRHTALQALGRRQGATEFMVSLAAYAIFLSRISRQDDLAIGTPIAGRSHADLENLIGFFVNTLVLRIDLTESNFFGLLHRIREVSLGAYAHQDVPFEKLVEELAPQRSLSHAPLVQVLFVFQNFPLEPLRLLGIEAEALAADTGSARFDLTLSLYRASGGLAAEAEYATALFDGSTIDRLLRSFTVLLTAALADPARPLCELPLLGGEERWQILGEWNGGTTDHSEGSELLHELFLRQAERTPDAVALVIEGQETTYAALRHRAVAIAARLRGLGVRPEIRVGIFLDRGPDLVPALLGTLLAGGAYVPLDPTFPTERIAFLIADAGTAMVLTRGELVDRLPREDVAWILVDELVGEAGELPEGSAADPYNLAYLMYTSGSTGGPKGVAITHASAVALLGWALRMFSPDELAGTVAATTISFDLSVFEIFVPLACGGTVLLVENALAIPHLTDGRARLVNTVPTAAAALLRGGGLPASVRTVNLAGETLPGELVRDLHAAGVERVYNLYGPTEDTTYSTGARIAPGEFHPEIGRPLSGTRAYVLGAGLEPVPTGVAGELHLAGAGLTRGYLGRPSLTAEKLIPDPFATRPGGRLYATGDLARWRPDGNLEFLGRYDHQVKIRGFRIEPGEIEAVLTSHPGVAAAVVVPQEIRPDGRRLVAYAIGRPGQELDLDELRDLTTRRLPGYMVPEVFLTLPALPLYSNGKVDRRALPLPAIRPRADYVPPRTVIEEGIAEIWSDLLGVDRVGAEDSFFELGGHSLLAAQMVSRVRKAYGVEPPLRTIFEKPMLSAFAAAVLERQVETRNEEDLERLLAELERMDEEEVWARLAPEGGLDV